MTLLATPALRDVATPALVVDEAAMDANIAGMAAFARTAGIALRPHAKTHKSSVIARKQMAAGAIGISCATVPEAEALANGGLDNLLLTSPIADPARAGRVAALNRLAPMHVVVDHPRQVGWLAEAVGADDPTLTLLVDIDLGQKRTGVVDRAAAVALATLIGTQNGLAFGGLQGFGGHIQHVVDASDRDIAAANAAAYLGGIADALRAAGRPCRIVSGSGTGTYADDSTGPYTELQVGSYLFMDADYRALRRMHDTAWPFAPALFVLTTVVSANRTGQITVDAGVKALAVNGPPPDLLLGAPPGSRYRFAGDEHGVIDLPGTPPDIGTRLLIAATHCDPTVNNFATYVFVSPSGDIRRVAIEGRYG